MTKHTPGPWSIATEGHNEGLIVGADGYPICSTFGQLVNGSARDGEPITEANTRLIAAAPELLAAAEHALIHISGSFDDDQSMTPVERQLIAAIKKAKGDE